MTSKTKLISVVFMFFLLAGCASFVETGYDTIKTSNYAVDKLMDKAGQAYQEGNLNDKQKSKIISIYNDYHAASNAADEALAIYKETKSSKDKRQYLESLEKLNEQKSKFKNIIKELLNDK